MSTDRPSTESSQSAQPPSEPDPRAESGLPGGGRGRRDEVGGSGVYPASAGKAPDDAEIRTMAAWGQGERGTEGYEDSGQSELSIPPEIIEDSAKEENQER
jgi:hypothetical protein